MRASAPSGSASVNHACSRETVNLKHRARRVSPDTDSLTSYPPAMFRAARHKTSAIRARTFMGHLSRRGVLHCRVCVPTGGRVPSARRRQATQTLQRQPSRAREVTVSIAGTQSIHGSFCRNSNCTNADVCTEESSVDA